MVNIAVCLGCFWYFCFCFFAVPAVIKLSIVEMNKRGSIITQEKLSMDDLDIHKLRELADRTSSFDSESSVPQVTLSQTQEGQDGEESPDRKASARFHIIDGLSLLLSIP